MISSIDATSLVVILLSEALVGNLTRLNLQLLTNARVVCQHFVLVVANTGYVGSTPLLINHPLLFFLPLEVHLVPIHHCGVLIASLLDLVREVGMLLGNLDLFLQPLFFIVQLSQSVLEHLRLDLLLLHVQLLLELAGAIEPCSFIRTLWRLKVVKFDIAKAEVLAHQLFSCHFLRPSIKLIIHNKQDGRDFMR